MKTTFYILFILCSSLSLLSVSCNSGRPKMGTYRLDSVLNSDLAVNYKNSIVLRFTNSKERKLDSLRSLLMKYRDSVKNGLIRNNSKGFQNYNLLKKQILISEGELKELTSEVSFIAKDSLYRKVSNAVYALGKKENMGIILPKNEYSLNYLNTEKDLTDKLITTLKRSIK